MLQRSQEPKFRSRAVVAAVMLAAQEAAVPGLPEARPSATAYALLGGAPPFTALSTSHAQGYRDHVYIANAIDPRKEECSHFSVSALAILEERLQGQPLTQTTSPEMVTRPSADNEARIYVDCS